MRVISPKRLMESVFPTVRNGGIFNTSSLDLQFARTKTLDPRITFTRASSGTYVGSDGLIKTATTNLLLRSEEFNVSPWAVARCTISANTTAAPNGSITADTLVEDTTSNSHPIYVTTSSLANATAYTASVYVKASTRDRVRLVLFGTAFSGGPYVDFNLPSLTATGASGGTGTIVAVGSGWYRCSLTATSGASGTTDVYIQPLNASGNPVYLGNGSDALHLWGAQLEQSSTVGEYIPTTSTINSAPRFDHAITASRTNLLLRSEEFDNAYWVKSGASITQNAIAAPNGSINADTLVENTANTIHYLTTTVTVANTTHTHSIYAKPAGRDWIALQGFNGTTNPTAYFNVSAGTVGTVSPGAISAIAAAGNGWYRCSITYTVSSGAATTAAVYLASANGTAIYSGDGVSGVYLWGAQLETGSTATSYIPTTTAAVTVNTTESLGLLVEEQRTNSIRNSTMVGAVAGTPGTNPTNWPYVTTQSNGLTQSIIGTGTENGINYIDYRFNGTTIVSPGAVVASFDSGTALTGQTWAGSVFLRLVAGAATGITSTQLGLIETNSSGTFVTGALYTVPTPTSASLISQRSSATRTLVGGATVANCMLTLNINVAGSTAIDFTLRIGMPQLEQGAFATSVIPTTTATVTRSADVASITGANFSSWYRQDEGTVFGDFTASPNTFTTYAALSNGTTSQNSTYIDNDSGNIRAVTFSSSAAVSVLGLGAIGSTNVFSKIASTYKANDFAAVRNAGTVQTDTSGAVPASVSQMNLGSNPNGLAVTYLNGTIRRLTYWPSRLPNSTLQEITR